MNGSRSNYQQQDWGLGRGAIHSAYLSSNQIPSLYTGGTPPVVMPPPPPEYQPSAARMADLEFTIQRMRMEMEQLYTKQHQPLPTAPPVQPQYQPIYYPVSTPTPSPPPQKVMGPEAIVFIGLIFVVVLAVILVQVISKSNDLVNKTTEMLYRSTELTTRLLYGQQWLMAQQHQPRFA